MIKFILDLLDIFSVRIQPRRISWKDRIANNFAVLRFWFIRNFLYSRMEDWSDPKKEGYTLVFEDTFKKENWDREGKDKWRIGEGWGLWHPGKPNVYYGPPEITSNRYTKFTCKYNPKEFPTEEGGTINIPYEVSLLSSDGWFRKKYGRFECRMTLPDAPYSFPAFWLWAAPPYGEIDVFEGKGRSSGKTVVYQNMNLHRVDEVDGIWKHLRTSIVKIANFKNFQGNFFEFAVEWTPDKIEIFTNGMKVFQYTNKDVLSKNFAHPMWIVINNSVHPTYKEIKPDYHSEFYIDYIRVYDINK